MGEATLSRITGSGTISGPPVAWAAEGKKNPAAEAARNSLLSNLRITPEYQ
jgi:hypothetical protein